MLLLELPAPLAAQGERYELGQRLRRFETAWETAGEAERKAAVAPLQSAVQSFFQLQLRTAAARLDEAWVTVRGAEPPAERERYLVACRLESTPAVLDTTEAELQLQLRPFYQVPRPESSLEGTVRFRLEPNATGTEPAAEPAISEPPIAEFPLAEVLEGVRWKLPAVRAGDYRMHVTVLDGNLELPPRGVSLVEDLTGRLERLEVAIDAMPETAAATVRETCRMWLDWMQAVGRQETQEVDYPIHRLLEAAERLASSPGDADQVLFRLAVRGQLWCRLSDGRRRVPVRVQAPEKVEGARPVLFLFHGAGGSENMFFETYGAGRAVSMAVERGWLVVAPRQGLFGLGMDCGPMLDELEKYFPLDRTKIYLMGHSMGAAQVVRQVSRQPDLVSAAVAMGGGGAAPKAAAAQGVRWFVTAGEHDFGRTMASTLADSLRRASASVEYRQVADVEHLVIVQAALDQAFAFLDR